MFKLLCTDMDGTLLNDEKEISNRNLKAVKLAHEKGVKVVVCTGRMFTSADFYSDLLKVKAPVVSSNGAFIREKDRDEVIYKGLLGKENCIKVLNICKKYCIDPNFHTINTIFIEKQTHSALSYAKFNERLPENKKITIRIVEDWEKIFETYENEILKCIVVDKDGEKIDKAKIELSKQDSLEVVSSFINNFEVMNRGVSKGRAVEILAEYYKIKREEIICIGDNENDISMIKYAGLGVAMKNGEKCVRAAAKYITDTNNQDGVAKVIEKFILNNK